MTDHRSPVALAAPRYVHLVSLIKQQDGVLTALRGGRDPSLINDALDVRYELMQQRDAAYADASVEQEPPLDPDTEVPV